MKPLKRYQYERYAVLCQLAYPRIFRHTQYGFDPKGQRIIYNQYGKIVMRVLWSQADNEVIVVIKGSHSVRDWLATLAMHQRSARALGLPYKIHAGFLHLMLQESRPSYNSDTLGLSVIERLQVYLAPLVAEGKRITITGHSSGGAMGCVIADMMERQHPHIIKRVITFGQPAIGGWSFHRHYKLQQKTYRICCDLDIVTFLPPMPFYYWHVGKLLWLHNQRVYENIPPVIRLGRTLLSWAIRPFSYHLMSRYIRNKDFFDQH
ncbi:lipase family protein [Vibrio tritonius]|uniref:lipase family protein n=1 Tax=Vibrio tritonius TaxID=1435069 RepID=UPI00315DF131